MQSCSQCGKGSKKSASRSHSKIKTLRRQNVNLQKLNGEMVCARCIRNLSKKTK